MISKAFVTLFVLNCLIAPVYSIIGGQFINVKSVPYLVSVQRNNSHVCGGSIINTQFVLTAAHCESFDRTEIQNFFKMYSYQVWPTLRIQILMSASDQVFEISVELFIIWRTCLYILNIIQQIVITISLF